MSLLRSLSFLPLAYLVVADGHASDATVLVQNTLGALLGNASQDVLTPLMSLRLTITRTHGDDHVCLNELSFEDEFEHPLYPVFESMSSCYGCALDCRGCTSEYGNAVALFDNVSGEDAAWICSEHGGFNGTGVDEEPDTGYGTETIIFALKQRPYRFKMAVKQAGRWNPKNWHLEEYLQDKLQWSRVAQVTGAAEFEEHWTTLYQGPIDIPTNYPYGWPVCAGAAPEPIRLTYDRAGLNIRIRSQDTRVLLNNGHGAEINGDFGFVNYSSKLYQLVQVNWRFPSRFLLPNNDLAAGEMHIVGIADDAKLLVIDLLLQLPLENTSLDTDTEKFFLGMGLAALPNEGIPQDLLGPFDLHFFEEFLSGGYHEMPCEARPNATWVVLAKPAKVSGLIVQSFTTRFPNPLNYGEDTVEVPAAVTPTPVARDWRDFRFSDAAQTQAYLSGEFAQGPPIVIAEPAAVPDAL